MPHASVQPSHTEWRIQATGASGHSRARGSKCWRRAALVAESDRNTHCMIIPTRVTPEVSFCVPLTADSIHSVWPTLHWGHGSSSTDCSPKQDLDSRGAKRQANAKLQGGPLSSFIGQFLRSHSRVKLYDIRTSRKTQDTRDSALGAAPPQVSSFGMPSAAPSTCVSLPQFRPTAQETFRNDCFKACDACLT
jgi:hypothetical protein